MLVLQLDSSSATFTYVFVWSKCWWLFSSSTCCAYAPLFQFSPPIFHVFCLELSSSLGDRVSLFFNYFSHSAFSSSTSSLLGQQAEVFGLLSSLYRSQLDALIARLHRAVAINAAPDVIDQLEHQIHSFLSAVAGDVGPSDVRKFSSMTMKHQKLNLLLVFLNHPDVRREMHVDDNVRFLSADRLTASSPLSSSTTAQQDLAALSSLLDWIPPVLSSDSASSSSSLSSTSALSPSSSSARLFGNNRTGRPNSSNRNHKSSISYNSNSNLIFVCCSMEVAST